MRIPFSVLIKLRLLFGDAKHVKKSTSVGLIAILTLSTALPLLGFILPAASPVQAASWWNEDYRYRQQIDITSDTNQSNVYVTLTLDTSSTTRFKADCADLRFLDLAGQTIPYYVVSGCGTASTSVQLLFISLPVGPTSIYLYHANPAATAQASLTSFNNPAPGTSSVFQTEELSPAPIGNWKFDEGYGSSTHSSSTKDYPGTITGAAWQQEDMCVSGKCLYFDGSTDDVAIPTDQMLQSSDWSFSVWVNPRVLTLLQGIVRVDASTATNGYVANGVDVNSDGRIRAYSRKADGSIVQLFSPAINTSNWLHITVSQSSQTLSLYVNGQRTGQASGATIVLDKNVTIYLGKQDASGRSDFKGSIDSFKLYNYARTQAQIQQDYLAGKQQMAAQQSNLADGLTAYYKMDEASWNGTLGEVKDSSGSGNHGTASGGAATTSGKYGSAAQFDGVNDTVIVEDNPSFNFGTGDFSISTWIKIDNPVAGMPILGKDFSGSGPGYGIRLGASLNPTFWIYDTSGTVGSTVEKIMGESIESGKWYNLVATRKSGQLNTYVNAVIRTPAVESTATTTSAYRLYLGARGAAVPGPFMAGQLDETRMYNRALSAAEVAQLYTYAPKPVSYWDFEEGAGSIAYDKSGNSNNGTWSGSNQRYAAGKIGTAATFDGSTNYVNVPAYSAIDYTKNYTISVWVNPSVWGNPNSNCTNKRSHLITTYLAPNVANVGLELDNMGKMTFRQYGNPDARAVTTNVIALNSWTYVTAVANPDEGNFKIYINGVLVSTAAISDSITSNPSGQALRFGQNGYNCANTYYGGQLDEIKLYNYARTPDQVLSDMQSSNPDKANPLGYWKFDENQGVTTHSSTTNTYPGTLDNSPTWSTNCIKGSCLQFNGTNQRVVVNDNGDFNFTDSFTASVWLKTDYNSTGTYRAILGKFQSPAIGWDIGLDATCRPRVTLRGASLIDTFASANSYLCDQAWHQFVAVAKTDSVTIYVDGKQIYRLTGNWTPAVSSGSYYMGSRSTATDSFLGYLDEVKLYNTALTSQQVAVDYNQSFSVISGALSTAPTLTQSGATSSKPSNSTDTKYCVPGSTDYCAKPVGEWNFEEGGNSVVKDGSGNGDNGTWGGSLGGQWTNGKSGKAGYFNGSNNYVQIPDTPHDDFGLSSMSFSAWVKLDSLPVDDNIVMLLDNKVAGTNAAGFNFYFTSTGMGIFRIADGSSQYSTLAGSQTTILDGQWHYYNAVLERNGGSGTVSIYQDGILRYATPSLGIVGWNISSSRSIFIGAWGTGVNNGNLHGRVDGVKIYNYARTPAQVAWDYNNGKPVAWYKLNECSGTIINDSSNPSLSATLNLGSAGTTVAGNCNASGTAWGLGKLGKEGSSLAFDGQDDYISAGHGTDFQFANTTFTATGWLKTSASGVIQYVLAKGVGNYGGLYQGWGIGVSSTSGKLSILVKDTSNNQPISRSSSTIVNDGKWHHFAVVITTSTTISAKNDVQIYLDGSLNQVAPTTSSSVYSAGNAPLEIGRRVTGEYFNGQLDDIQLFNYGLTPTQIKTLYNGGAVRWGQ